METVRAHSMAAGALEIYADILLNHWRLFACAGIAEHADLSMSLEHAVRIQINAANPALTVRGPAAAIMRTAGCLGMAAPVGPQMEHKHQRRTQMTLRTRGRLGPEDA